jgi:hypothetical protein
LWQDCAQPNFSEEQVEGIKRQLRHEYRGERVYIAKFPDKLHDIIRSRFTGRCKNGINYREPTMHCVGG